MKLILEEYGSMLLSVTGALLILGILGATLLAKQGVLTTLISMWGNGGC